MTTTARYRRMGWFAALSICIVLYTLLHLKVNAVHSDVVQAEREIVRLEQQNMLLETEFLTRSNQVQLARLNRINFGFKAPRAEQFIDGERHLAQFGSPREEGAPAPIRLAGMTSEEGLPAFPQLVSPLTGEPVDTALVELDQDDSDKAAQGRLVFSLTDASREVSTTLVSLRADVAP